MGAKREQIAPGTLDMLILKVPSRHDEVSRVIARILQMAQGAYGLW